jgi:hypothetical protein
MAHEIRIRINGNDGAATLTVDSNTITVGQDLAVILWNAMIEYLNNYCVDCKWYNDGTAKYVMSRLTVRIRRSKDEVEFVIEE